MGMYLNLGNAAFQSIRKTCYVDKSGLIAFMNSTLGTKDKLTCVSRPRRFGKSFAAQMLCAYYDKSCQSKELFMDLDIAKEESFEKYMNRYDVIYLDITWFISNCQEMKKVVSFIQEQVIQELRSFYPNAKTEETLPMTLSRINEVSGEKFIIIIDEWDALFREAKDDTELQKEYIQLLRGLFKSSQTDKMIEAAYMTGILPIKKYGTQSALTDFREYTMIQPKKLARYVGFTEAEVAQLCETYHMDFEDMKMWYDGYRFSREKSVYSPNSVIEAIKNEEYGTYWTETETYESLKSYINMNFDGLRDAIIRMLGGQRCKIVTRKFQNDMTSISSKDDVMTLLIHLGYLAYDSVSQEVSIPNQEVADEFKNVIEDDAGWGIVAKALRDSEQLLDDTLAGRQTIVAERIDEIHAANTSVLSYNDENSLSCVITLAYFSAQRDYKFVREMPAGNGFADIVFLPRKHTDKPALVVELKWNKSAVGAIRQIKEKRYPDALEAYEGSVVLVGINYDKKTKKHDCAIEEYKKGSSI